MSDRRRERVRVAVKTFSPHRAWIRDGRRLAPSHGYMVEWLHGEGRTESLWKSFARFGYLDCRNSSAVDDNLSAVDIGSAVGYQESNKLGHFFGATGATDWNAAE